MLTDKQRGKYQVGVAAEGRIASFEGVILTVDGNTVETGPNARY